MAESATMWTNITEKNKLQGPRLDGTLEVEEADVKLPPAVNWHFWPWCNYGCKFCFATFEELPFSEKLPKEQALKIPEMLAKAGAKKITFVGGEPTLCPYIGELLVESKRVGLTTCIVSNGSKLTDEFLEKWNSVIDWVGISIDSSNDEVHQQMGRGLKKDLLRSKSHHLEESIAAWNRCVAHGIRMKLNTVVCRQNMDDDMTSLVNQLQPERWKVFQVLPVKGQNDEYIDSMTISGEQFQAWVERHQKYKNEEIPMICEGNDLMRGSYAMMDALGRFYSNTSGGHLYGPSVFDEGVLTAWEKNEFSEENFHSRGGEYDWKNTRRLPMASQYFSGEC